MRGGGGYHKSHGQVSLSWWNSSYVPSDCWKMEVIYLACVCVFVCVRYVIKSRMMRWVGHVVSMGGMRNVYNFFTANVRDHLEDLGVNGKIILDWILGNRVGRCGLGLSESG